MEPKIRLKGFSGKWETDVIGNIASFSKGHGYSKSDLKPEGCPIILYGRLYTNYSSIINSVDTFATLQNGSVLSEGNEVIIPGSGETPEDIAIASSVEQKGVILGGDLNVVTFDSDKIIPAFAAMNISNSKTHYELSGYAQGKTVVHLHNSSISKGHMSYPSKEEQKAIVSYVSSIDSLIQSTTKKIESLKQVKAASLQSMFPQEGETTPRVRFKGFEGEWEKKSFGDHGTVSMCRRIFKNETTSEGEIPFYKIGTFGKAPDAYISRELYDDYRNRYCYPKKGDILISAAGTIGRVVEYNGEDAYFQDSNIVWLNHNDQIDNLFLKQLYGIVKWAGLEGATIKRLYNSNFLETEFLTPSISEQTQIGKYFSSLDTQISLQTQRLEKLKQIKSACLDKMFV